jgi:membrane protein YqaA with SNARE-associated domain
MILLQYLLVTFVISFVSNATPFFGAPYTLVASSLLLTVGITPYNFLLFVLSAGIAASLSKTIMYFIGIVLRRPLRNSKNIKFVSRFINKISFYLLLFIFSIIPFLPLDDYLFIVGGVSGGRVVGMLGVSILGKILKTSIEMIVELEGLRFTENLLKGLGLSYLDLGLIGTVIFILLGIGLAKLDWEKFYDRAVKLSHRDAA